MEVLKLLAKRGELVDLVDKVCVCVCVCVCGLKLDNARTILHTIVSPVPNTARVSQLSGA